MRGDNPGAVVEAEGRGVPDEDNGGIYFGSVKGVAATGIQQA